MAARQKRGGVEVDGLAEAVKALGVIDKQLKREAVEVMRDAAKEVQSIAQARIGSGGYRGPTQKGMIGRSATQAGAGVKLRAQKFPWALKAEYGERVTHVHGHPWRQTNLSRRTTGSFKPPTSSDLFKNKGGYMIQPAIFKSGPRITKTAQLKLFLLFRKHLGRR